MLKNRIFLRGLFKARQAFVGLLILVSLCHYQGFCHPTDEEMAPAKTACKSRMADLQDLDTRFMTFGFWATGMQPEDSSFSSDQFPKVEIGGPEDGPRFLSSVETFLEALSENYSYYLMLDRMTWITNKKDLDHLQEKFGERFRLIDIEQLGAQLIKKFPQYEEVLTDVTQNATGGMPVITSDIYRLIAMPYADKSDPDFTEKTRYLYLDIDTFVRGLSESKTLPFWLSKGYNTSSTDVTLCIPSSKYPCHSELERTDFFNPFAGGRMYYPNSQIGIEIPFQGQNQYETFVRYVLERVKTLNYYPRAELDILKFPLKLYKNLLAGKGMTFTGDLSEKMNRLVLKDIYFFTRFLSDHTANDLLANICQFHGEKFRILEGSADWVGAKSWVPKNKTGSFCQGYIEQAWSGRGILAIDAFLDQTQQ